MKTYLEELNNTVNTAGGVLTTEEGQVLRNVHFAPRYHSSKNRFLFCVRKT